MECEITAYSDKSLSNPRAFLLRNFVYMIHLQPYKRYKILYGHGHTYPNGHTAYFETLDTIPEAKHLIRVRDTATGEIVDFTDFLSHPWLDIEEVEGE